MKSGIPSEELGSLLDGALEDSPDEEKIALHYAQHWTGNDSEADRNFKEKLVETYGKKKSEPIDFTIRSIEFGNLLVSTFDYFLYKITFGLLGS